VDCLSELLSKALAGDELSIGRLITEVENLGTRSYDYVDKLMKLGGKAHVVGVTGPQGVGKSSLINALALLASSKGMRVAILTVDPSSPLTSGSFMGNRIRMTGLEKVFIRSLATRGFSGGLGVHASLSIEIMDGLGFDLILLETVGAGQVDTDVMHVAHTVIVVLAPGVGDEVQALKSGLMEIGHIYVINKSDLPEALKLEDNVKFVLSLKESEWTPKVVKVSALKGEGVDQLYQVLQQHREWLNDSGRREVLVKRRRKLLELLLLKMAEDSVRSAIRSSYVTQEFTEGKIGLKEAIEKLKMVMPR